MSEEVFNEAEEEWIKAQRDRARKRNKKSRYKEPEGGVSFNSLMDIMVIILVFLLKSYGDEPVKVIGKDLKAPTSATELNPEDMTTITVSQRAVLVNDKKVVDIKAGTVDASQKKDGAAGLLIQPLFDQLVKATDRKKQQVGMLGQEYKPIVTIIADQSTPFRLVTEVMYTAGQAELSMFKFAVVKGDKKRFQ